MKLFMTIFATFACIMIASSIPIESAGQNRMTRSVTGLTSNVVEIKDKFVSGTNMTKKSIKALKKKFDEFDALIDEADENIYVVQKNIAELVAQNIKFTKEFLTDYHIAKEEVRIIRQELRKLATKTISACNKMKKLIEYWDEKETAFIKQQFKLMRELLAESLETLENAKVRYNKAITSIDKASEQLRIFKAQVFKMTDVNSWEHKQWVEKARAIAYTSAGVVQVGLAAADFLGCFGACSSIGGTILWGATAGTLEAKIVEYTNALNALIKIGDKVKGSITNFNEEMKNIRASLIEEIKLITDWEVAAEDVNNTIDSFSIEELKAIAAFQTIFVVDLDALKKTAEDYLN